MQTWYYSKSGEQKGPVPLDELIKLVSGGDLNPDSDLAWTEGMTNWQPVGTIPALSSSGSTAAIAASSSDAFNPYAAPVTAPDNLLAPPSVILAEIEPGSAPLEVTNCIKRGIELTKRHFGAILVIGIVYILISMGVGFVEGFVTSLVTPSAPEGGGYAFSPLAVPIQIVSAIISLVLAAGVTRAALNICAGREANVGNLFGEAGKVITLTAASILFYIMLVVGLLLLIVPGIFVALRFGFFVTAIVDRNLSAIDALKYSYRITTNNALSLFGLGILCFMIALAGALVLLVGLIFALPVITLAFTLAYRFLQYGPDALRDTAGSADSNLAFTTR